MDRKVLLASQAISRRLVKQGAEAVVLFGSRVRGDAYKESDIDIQAIGRGPHYGLERNQGFLISVAWMTLGQHHQAFKDPSKVGGIIPAWRNAAIIYDPQGIAGSLKQEAKRWQWKPLSKQADRWVAEETTGWA
jgi:hypothetical protein